MAARKTFSVDELRLWVNDRLRSDYITSEHKHGLANALDHVLQKTGNYKGFGYVYIDDVRPCFPDKVGAEACNPAWTEEHEYRRMYY
jgi:hypothetical protein